MPKIHLPEPVQITIIVVAAIVFLFVLAWYIRRALRPKPDIPVDVGPPVIDPNAPFSALGQGNTATAGSAATSAGQTVASTSVVSAVSERAGPTTPVVCEVTEARVGHDGDTEFVKVWPSQLDQITIVASAIDNQWESRKVLAHMRNSFAQKPLGLADIRDMRRHAGRAEYVRALLNSRQLVSNRVFLYNCDYIAEDYVQPGDTRAAFIELLNKGVLIPHLLTEHSPSEIPRNVEIAEAFIEWQRVCSEAQVRALRLNWDDSLNQKELGKLGGRFALWLHGLGVLDKFGDINALAANVGLSAEQIPDFRRRLLDVTHWVEDQGDVVYRGAFYENFIIAPNTKALDGIIDFDQARKPFASELKQLADLSYATNLPDALGRFALTPMDSLPRTALQELNITIAQGKVISQDDIKSLLQREAFDLISGMEALSSMEHLSLRDVIELRATDEWRLYILAMQGLIDHPQEFEHRSKLIYDRYIALARLMTDKVKEKGRQDALERWSPVVKLVLTVGTSSLSIWSPFDTSMAGKILYNVTDGAIGQVANLTARMIIGGIADRRAEAELETSLDFMRGRLDNAEAAWSQTIGKLRSDPRFVDATSHPDRSQDEFDPNINFQEDIPTIAN